METTVGHFFARNTFRKSLIYKVKMPVNLCEIIVSTGTNKGKRCCDINKYCRHQKTNCSLCGEAFSHKSSYLRHRKTVHGDRPDPIGSSIDPSIDPTTDPHPKRAVNIRPKSDDSETTQLRKELMQLKEDFQKVTARVNKVEQEPKNITVVIGDEKIFMGLVKRMGNEKVVTKFLLENMDHKHSINIVEKMYLEGIDKNRYPIACADNYRFRYLSLSGAIIDDDGGDKIVSTLENEIHSALIEANTRLIYECIDNDNNVMLYNVYNLNSMQEQLGNYRGVDTQQLREDLAKKVYNTSHPFFQ
jgi:hypothetical protein